MKMAKFDIEQLSLNPRIRNCEIDGIPYFSIIDVLAELRGTDFWTAQTYYHVLKNRMRKNGVAIPHVKQIKARTNNNKFYFTDFTTQVGVAALLDYLEPNLRKEHYRLDVRQEDERINFHPLIIAFFENNGWRVEHHLRLLFGSQIDIVATLKQDVIKAIFIVECKPRLHRSNLYSAIGQVLCYWAEYGKAAIPVIATYSSQIDDYVEACCEALGIRLLAADMLEHTTITYNKSTGYDLVTEKLLPTKKKSDQS